MEGQESEPEDDRATAGVDGNPALTFGQAMDLLHSDPDRAAALLEPQLSSSDGAEAVRARVLLGLHAWLGDDPDTCSHLLHEAQSCIHLLGDSEAAAQFHLLQGRLQRSRGEYRQAALSFGQGAQVARRLADTPLELDALNLQASAVNALGQPQRALQLLRRAVKLGEQTGHLERLATIRNNTGDLERVLGNYPEALEELVAARSIFSAAGKPDRASAINLINLANLYQDMGRQHEARRFLMDAREEGEQLADADVVAVALNSLANSDLQLGDYQVARERFAAALVKARTLGDTAYQADNLDGLGQALAALGDYEGALETHEQTLELARADRDYEGELDARVNLGRDQLHLGRPEQAVQHLDAALELAAELEYSAREVEVHELLSAASEAAGDPWA
ncbi:MAG TPA: tetratricopeptide repeat protein, partial [Deinococcales bacterium]|nr:tetratricopeptide repeat protein [Deinococcales bacterium]